MFSFQRYVLSGLSTEQLKSSSSLWIGQDCNIFHPSVTSVLHSILGQHHLPSINSSRSFCDCAWHIPHPKTKVSPQRDFLELLCKFFVFRRALKFYPLEQYIFLVTASPAQQCHYFTLGSISLGQVNKALLCTPMYSSLKNYRTALPIAQMY